ncbi:MAG: tellurite resistance TerB family protein, partial [Rubrimonas sp.]
MTAPFTAQDGLAAVMVLTAAADASMTDAERDIVAGIVALLPVFRGFPEGRFGQISDVVVQMLTEEDGVDQILTMLEEALPDHLRDTAYALACDVAAADGAAGTEELRLLEILRDRL